MLLAPLYSLWNGQPEADWSDDALGSYPGEQTSDGGRIWLHLCATRVCYVAVIVSSKPSLLIGSCDEHNPHSP